MRGCLALLTALLLLATATPSSAQATFDATFAPKAGNAWWVETAVSGNQPIVAIEARINEGTWVPLAKQSWGTWAKSMHAPDGSIVEFLARSSSGATDVSGRYRWPQASPVTDPAPPPAALTFDHRGGNEWWVEVRTTGSYSVYVMHAEESDGSAKQLTLNQYGNWVGSTHIEPGHLVRFTANARDGTPALTSCWFTHPAGKTPTGGETCAGTENGNPQPPSIDVAFGPKAGNAWWVETFAFTGKAAGDVRQVDARVNAGAWKPLTLRSWGAWAASFNVPDGSTVEFRATTGSGSDVSDRFTWPTARLAGGSGAWPEEGSYVHYRLAQGVAGSQDARLDAVFVRHGGAWWMECTGTNHGSPFYLVDYSRAPPFGALRTTQDPIRPITIGDDVQVGTLFGCQPGVTPIRVAQEHVHDTRNDGKTVPVQYWYGVTADDGCGGCNSEDADWDKATGLVGWVHNGGTGWSWAQMQDTDAPLQRA